MRNKPTLLSTLILFMIFLGFQSCEDDPSMQNQEEVNLVTRTLEIATPMDDIMLPVGTKVTAISESKMEIELPYDFKFLLYNEDDGISYSRFGGYSCTCSGSNSCKSFYNDKAGYGCLQNSCTGSCTGTPTGGNENKIVYGILNTKSDNLLGENFIESGNLTHKGLEIFFNNIAREKILNFTDFAYSNSNFKNSSQLLQEKGEDFGTYVILQYQGISFSTIIPDFDAANQVINLQKGPSISCAGNNGCNCIKDKICFLGQCVYTCEGCTTCTISADEKK